MDVIAEWMCLWMHKVLCAAAAGSGLESEVDAKIRYCR